MMRMDMRLSVTMLTHQEGMGKGVKASGVLVGMAQRNGSTRSGEWARSPPRCPCPRQTQRNRTAPVRRRRSCQHHGLPDEVLAKSGWGELSVFSKLGCACHASDSLHGVPALQGNTWPAGLRPPKTSMRPSVIMVPVCISRGQGGFPSATGVIHVLSPVLKIQMSPKVPCMPAPPKTSCIQQPLLISLCTTSSHAAIVLDLYAILACTDEHMTEIWIPEALLRASILPQEMGSSSTHWMQTSDEHESQGAKPEHRRLRHTRQMPLNSPVQCECLAGGLPLSTCRQQCALSLLVLQLTML